MTEPVVAVRGEINREVPPEIATVSVTVSARDRERQPALARLAERSTALGALLDGYAEAIERRETSGVYVYPETKGAGERIVGYRGSVTLQVTVTDFAVLGELMLRLADQDQTTVGGPHWALRPDSPAYRQARHDAIGDALTRAREYAEALGARITRLLQLADAGLSGSGLPAEGAPIAVGMRAMAFAADSGGGPNFDLEPRLQHVYASVEARFAMTEPVLD
ncbi:hypothetical protein GCM10009557_44060 [Virgisporangium ochraceum]|uniref:DUF541 domain-containing protein n=1 Tax=Virgisporangium ochraceum TaxID=65505 RepID=A0A8J4ED08_9ACTN|nr:SIMPL domain-containing protein [Virgisporangium ochraceum]GIJ70241.1 hypothetical protein Voc01_051580 [Virgisporangium ochraceum]